MTPRKKRKCTKLEQNWGCAVWELCNAQCYRKPSLFHLSTSCSCIIWHSPPFPRSSSCSQVTGAHS